jgi:hypothetical protein
MSVQVQRANSCKEPDLTPKYLLPRCREHVEVFLLDIFSTELPLSKPSICNKDRWRGGVAAGRFDGAIRFRCSGLPLQLWAVQRLCSRKGIGYRAFPGRSSLQLLNEEMQRQLR